MTARRHISIKKKYAGALLQLTGCKCPTLISYEHAKLMTADQIISLFQSDHYPILLINGGPDEPWNLKARLIAEHRAKTAKVDRPATAKARRLDKDAEAFRARLLAKTTGDRPAPRSRIQSRGFAKGHRPLRSRSSFRG